MSKKYPDKPAIICMQFGDLLDISTCSFDKFQWMFIVKKNSPYAPNTLSFRLNNLIFYRDPQLQVNKKYWII